MVLHHVRVSHEVKLVVGKRQWLNSNIALLEVNSVVRGYLLKNRRGWPIVHSRRAAPELHRVYGQRPELRSDVQDIGGSGAGRSMVQDMTQDSILTPA